MVSRSVYIVQPYKVGTKDRKSLAVIIPAQIAKEENLDPSTIFSLRVDSMKIILQVVSAKCEEEETMMTPSDKRFQAPNQQVSSSGD